MELRKDYEKLYQHWLDEFQQTELTALSQDLFEEYKKIINFINDYKEDKEDNLKYKLLESYKDNFNFLFKDLLKIREIKITNFALALKEINLDNVIEAEKLFYQNLVSSKKGYRKVKRLSIFRETEDLQLEKAEVVENGRDIGLEETDLLSEVKIAKKSETTIEESKEDYNYTLIRFLKKTPPLVGIDFINYGPFEKEDIANIPFKNAKILIYEKFAEKIDLT
ncbi:MAG: hypothetical protein ACFFA6_13365 [Promethearchaeota archaeon]